MKKIRILFSFLLVTIALAGSFNSFASPPDKPKIKVSCIIETPAVADYADYQLTSFAHCVQLDFPAESSGYCNYESINFEAATEQLNINLHPLPDIGRYCNESKTYKNLSVNITSNTYNARQPNIPFRQVSGFDLVK